LRHPPGDRAGWWYHPAVLDPANALPIARSSRHPPLWACPNAAPEVRSRVSKKRPSRKTHAPSRVLDRFSEEYWQQRVYRNTYTHQGRRFVVGRWSVKIQVAGVRRTFSLTSAGQAEAAREALQLYQGLTRENEPSAVQPPEAGPPRVHERSPPAVSPGHQADRTLPAYWKPRLIRRKYVDRLPGRADGEWSVLIEHRNERAYFPLGTTDEDLGAIAAAERFNLIHAQGWKQARLHFFREITVGVIWSANPFACTYTTILAVPATEPGWASPAGGPAARRQTLIIVEPDHGIRRALGYWLGRQQQAPTAVLSIDPDDAVAVIRRSPGALALVNIGTESTPGEHTIHALREECPRAEIFGFGSYEDSDHIFKSLSGVTGGYLLRRRSPEQLLEPVLGAAARSRADPPTAAQMARRYFERLFDLAGHGVKQPEEGLLTGREYEILSCLSKGYQDKEIADRLSISIWTVHSHLRKIFVKYGVHSRTEAVVKYLRL